MKERYHTRGHRARVNLKNLGDGDWYIQDVYTQRGFRQMGLMRELFREILADADAEGVTLMLDVGDGWKRGLSAQQLRDWYERLGFTSYVGRRMVREQMEEPEIRRYDGRALCDCGKTVYEHALAPHVLDYEGEPFVHLLCDGTLAKT